MDHSYCCCVAYTIPSPDILSVCSGSKSHAVVLNYTIHGPEMSAVDHIYCCADCTVPLACCLSIVGATFVLLGCCWLYYLTRFSTPNEVHSDTTAVVV